MMRSVASEARQMIHNKQPGNLNQRRHNSVTGCLVNRADSVQSGRGRQVGTRTRVGRMYRMTTKMRMRRGCHTRAAISIDEVGLHSVA